MARLNLTLAGETFTDLTLSDVGSSALRLAHDYFTKQDLVIRTAAAGGGTLLVEGTDFTLGSEDTYLSQQVTAVAGAGRNVFLTVQVTNAAYQTGALYFSGKYIGDAVEAQATIAASADNTLANGPHDRCVEMTAGAAEKDVVLGPVAANLDREVDVWKVDSGAGEVKLVANGTEKFLFRGAQYANIYVGLQDQHVKVRATSAGWRIVCGVVQPVALEPDIGGGLHYHRATLYSGDPADTNWTAIACAAELPDGVSTIGIDANLSSAAVRLVEFSNASGGTVHMTIHMSVATQRVWDAGEVFLDSSQQLWWKVDNADVSSLVVYMNTYKLGPV